MVNVMTNSIFPGTIEKDGIIIDVPVSDFGYRHYPLPSECDYWISLFTNLRDNFTNDEITEINNNNWKIVERNVND